MNVPTPDHLPTSEPARRGNVFSPDLATFKLVPGDGARRPLGLVNALAVAQRMREAMLARGDGLPRRLQALLSGHGPGGDPLQHPHLAILPLAAAGLALALPRDVRDVDRRQVLRAAGRIRRLTLGRLGVWNVVSWAA